MLKKISGAYTGGVVGAFVDSFNIWLLGKIGVSSWLGVGLQPEFSSRWLYPRLVWGGIWGLLFLIPFLKDRLVMRGFLFSLGPSAMMLFVVFPSMGRGLLGLGFGAFTPILVIFLNVIWGIVVSFWLFYSTKK